MNAETKNPNYLLNMRFNNRKGNTTCHSAEKESDRKSFKSILTGRVTTANANLYSGKRTGPQNKSIGGGDIVGIHSGRYKHNFGTIKDDDYHKEK